MIKEEDLENIQIKIKEDDTFRIFGANVIRREIKNVNWQTAGIKSSILRLYEFLIEKEYQISAKIEEFAEKYKNIIIIINNWEAKKIIARLKQIY